MNPAAKEFVPAHILKKRQEEAKKFDELTEQLDKVDLSANNKDLKEENGKGCNVGGDQKQQQQQKDTREEAQEVENSSNTNKNHYNSKQKFASQNETETDNNHSTQGIHNESNNQHHHNNNHESEYPKGLQEFIEEDEDDRYLLNAGEDLCTFNGEQFIIPGDTDEFDRPINAGYDFGNAEDNEDEDVCNAFEEFLDNLPDQ